MPPRSESDQVAGIILAAGSSSRLGRPKQLLTIAGITLVRDVVLTALRSRLRPIYVVTGHAASEVADEIGDLDVVVVHNRDFETGQASSMIAGMNAMSPKTERVVVLLGDQPTITAKVIDAVIESSEENPAGIVQARYRGLPSHPVLFNRSIFPELLAVSGDKGARDVLKRRAAEINYVDFDTDPPPDIDTEADHQRLCKLLES